MEPDVLAHLCRLLTYLESLEHVEIDIDWYSKLDDYTDPLHKVVNEEIAKFSVKQPMGETPKMAADRMKACLHFGIAMPEKCECDDDCPCKQGGCSPTDPANLDEDGFLRSSIFCEHANEAPVTCPCADNCYCKKHTCKPRALVKLPYGIVPRGGGVASGTNFETKQEETYYHCPNVCQGWHKGTMKQQTISSDARTGVTFQCQVCQTELNFAETRSS